MNRRRSQGKVSFLLALVAAGAIAAGLGVGTALWLGERGRQGADPDQVSVPGSPTVKTIIGRPRPAFSLPDSTGERRSVTQWDGQVLLINFWATWCAPCRDEIPILIELQRTYGERGYATLGIALDAPQAVAEFLDAFEVNYPSMVGEREAIAIGQSYGNALGVLPYSVLVDRKGIVRYAHLGLVDREPLEVLIAGLL